MAKVTVSSDRAVSGQLPPVCVRSGCAADRRVEVVSRIGGPSPCALLLVFAGPIGWLVILGLWLGVRGEEASVRVPLQRDAWHAIQRVTIVGRMLVGVGAVGILAVLLTDPSAVGGALAAAALLAGLFTLIAARLLLPRVSLDATRRWATLAGVHPAFRDAVLAERTSREPSDAATS
jgi:hypothetical protein